jgi:hypothetical protein
MSTEIKKKNDHIYYERHKEKLLARMSEYYKIHSETIKQRTKERYQEHKDDPEYKKKMKEYSQRNYLKYRSRKSLSNKKRWLNNRLKLLNYFGGKCERCGFSDYRALQIDHVYGNGAKEKSFYKLWKDPLKYLEKIKLNRSEYQLLCSNCNWIKKYERDENAKERIVKTQEN